MHYFHTETVFQRISVCRCSYLLSLGISALTPAYAAQDLVELRMVYGLLNGNSVDSDLFLGLHLLEQGLQYLADTCDVKAKRKTLFARRSEVPSMAGNVHDICICGKSDPLISMCAQNSHF